MKLIVSGATGFVATEIIRQALLRRDITSLVVLSRKPVTPPADADPSKLTQVLLDDYAHYPDHARAAFAGAHACIWTVAITPSKSRAHDPDHVRRICHASTLAGLAAMHASSPARPFRFLYISGAAVSRDAPATGPLGPYLQMRADTESAVLDLARKQPPGQEVDVGIARPGLVTSSATVLRAAWGAPLRYLGLAPSVARDELAAALLEQAVRGPEAETLGNDDLRKIGARVLAEGAAR